MLHMFPCESFVPLNSNYTSPQQSLKVSTWRWCDVWERQLAKEPENIIQKNSLILEDNAFSISSTVKKYHSPHLPHFLEVKHDSLEQTNRPQQDQNLPQLSIFKSEKARDLEAWLLPPLIMCACDCHLTFLLPPVKQERKGTLHVPRCCSEGK